MTLLEACEPFFQYACRLNRAARKGALPPEEQVRGEIKEQIAAARSRAAAEPALADSFEQIEKILLYFIDYLVRESRLPYARQWRDLAAEQGHPGGDEEFFDQLDATLADPTPGAAQRLAVFYTCLGLGFAGWYRGQPDHLRRKMTEISSRIRSGLDADRASRVCPEAYENVNTADLVEPPSRRLVGLGIVLAGLAVSVFLANIVLYRDKRAELVRALDRITTLALPGSADGANSPGAGR